MSKRVYKFMSAQYGISNLENRRLKLSTLDDLNDPFDLHRLIAYMREAVDVDGEQDFTEDHEPEPFT